MEPTSRITPKRPTGNAGRCTKQGSQRRYAKKRRNVGKKKEDGSNTTPVSVKKVKTIKKVSVCEIRESPKGFRLLDLTILQDILSLLLCPDCAESSLYMYEKDERKKGLSSCLCLHCGFEKRVFYFKNC